MLESSSEKWGISTDVTFPSLCYVDANKYDVLYIRISHIITDNYVICFNHTASFIGCEML